MLKCVYKRVYQQFATDSWLVGLALTALGMSLVALGLTGCSDSGFDPHRDWSEEPCSATEPCPAGWVCGNDSFEQLCDRAYDGVNGVTADKIVIGNSSGHESGGAVGTSRAVVDGVMAFIKRANEQLVDGIHGRQLELDLRDNGYDAEEAKRDTENMTNQVDGSRKVFAIVGNLGTPPAATAHMVANENRTLFFAPVTGASFLRKTPAPDRYIFNYRVSDEQQAAAGGKWMTETRTPPINPRNIAVFAQGNSDGGQDTCKWNADGTIICPNGGGEYDKRVAELDGFGVAGYTGMIDYLKLVHNIDNPEVIFASHERGMVNIRKAMERYLRWLGRPKGTAGGVAFDAGILLQVVTDPAATLVTTLRDEIASVKGGTPPHADKYGTFTQDELDEIKLVRDVVFVGTLIGGAFASELKAAGNDDRYCKGVLAMQVVPHPQLAQTKLAIEYREALKAFDATLQPDVFSFEGYIAMKLFAEALRQAGRDLSTESLVATLESMDKIDIGLGVDLAFGDRDHQASQIHWAQQLTNECRFDEFSL